MRRFPLAVITVLTFLGLVSVPVFASTPSDSPRLWDEEDGPPPSAMFTSRKCRVDAVGAGRQLVLFDHATEQQHRVTLPKSVAFRARSKKDFDGRKRLQFSDLAAGQEVKVTFERLDEGMRIVRIQVLRPGPSSDELSRRASLGS